MLLNSSFEFENSKFESSKSAQVAGQPDGGPAAAERAVLG